MSEEQCPQCKAQKAKWVEPRRCICCDSECCERCAQDSVSGAVCPKCLESCSQCGVDVRLDRRHNKDGLLECKDCSLRVCEACLSASEICIGCGSGECSVCEGAKNKRADIKCVGCGQKVCRLCMNHHSVYCDPCVATDAHGVISGR